MQRLTQLAIKIRRDNAARNASILIGVKTGTIVNVKLDGGETVQRELLSPPWTIGDVDWVAKVSGISGGFCCSRITVPD